MGTPAEHLPAPLSEESLRELLKSIDLPPPQSIVSPKVTAEYHSIYFFTFDRPNGQLPAEMVLRVAGPHLPRTKTINEAAILTWLKQNTKVPVPQVVKYDASCDNPIRHEYILLERAPGKSLNDICKDLSDSQVRGIVGQLADFLGELHTHQWSHIGGLKFSESGEIVPGPVVEETFWQLPDIEKYWTAEQLEDGTPKQTVDSLNITGPFDSYVAYVSAHFEKYMHAIKVHKSLAFVRPLLPRIQAFVTALSAAGNSKELNAVKLGLAHKDLHFANIMCDPTSARITSILDWEFSGVVPFTRWNPASAFLWNGTYSAEAQEAQELLWDVFVEKCDAAGITIPKDQDFAGPKQAAMQKAANFLRAIVEVSPRGQKREDAEGKWKDALIEQLEVFGV